VEIALIFMLAGSLALLAQLSVLVAGKLRLDRAAAFERRVRRAAEADIILLLADEADEPARRRFAAALPSDPRARAAVAALILDYLPRLRGSVRDGVRALFSEAGFAEDYRRMLASRRREDRRRAAGALGALGDVAAFGDIARLLRDDAPEVRLQALAALGALGSGDAVAPILGAFAAGLVPFGPAAMSLLRLGAPAAPHLQHALTDPSPRVRALAAQLLGHLEWLPAAPDLSSLLRDPAPDVRREAARSLAHFGLDESCEPLALAMEDADPRLRAAAARALGATGAPRAVPILRRALADADPDVALAAAAALDALGRDGRAALAAAADADPRAGACADPVRAAGPGDLPLGPFGRAAAREVLDRATLGALHVADPAEVTI